MIKIIDLDKTGWLENKTFKSKQELKKFLIDYSKDHDFINFKHLDKLSLSYFLEVYNLNIEVLR